MKAPERITIALDEETARLFKKMKEEMGISQSELMRESLKFYGKHRSLFDFVEDKKVYTHAEMLSAGEHVILDIDHWLLFLNFVESHPDREKFWGLHREVCQAHAEQFKHKLFNAESILRRLEACNLFKLSKGQNGEFTLVLSSDLAKKFVKLEVEEIFKGMGLVVEIKEDFGKLRLKVIHDL
ncbi:MAG: Ribbon-helix-helix protein, copG family [Methanosaeta sp. PtaB.Bin039]|nr:MAG: Ribbon-helix-helix protein, copG family [Methanosaeta sp. PtaB.Bin039]OPY44231.1 MAG: Ribbon-helix-helix protein, copG family [Methanosaeta sp. PtaU1.Bin028]HOT07238.1 ribbon-helix-helix protein, CopG family [Methanotrichaceae archaeon]HQF17266.1 ribbon-helix-helix protein, CopG family [Methanotrichaceae archaeon]HQI91839.1 ribbon-helix-helix protein, CopG family [Methanotrichaceae archaeon]